MPYFIITAYIRSLGSVMLVEELNESKREVKTYIKIKGQKTLVTYGADDIVWIKMIPKNSYY